MSPELADQIQAYAQALERDDLPAAQAAVDRAVAIAPASAEAWGCRGEFYRHYGRQLPLALECFQRASVLDPGSHLGPACVAAVYEELEHGSSALEAWQEAIERSPGHPDLWRNRARFRDHRGDFEGALSDLDEAIRLAPAEVDAHCLRGEVLLRCHRFVESLRAFERALRVARGHERASAGRSFALGTLGQIGGANASRPTGSGDPGELRELSRVVSGELVALRYRVDPQDDALALLAQAREWLASLSTAQIGTQLVLQCGWRLELCDSPTGVVLAEFDLDRGPWRPAVLRLEVTHALQSESAAVALLDQLGVEGWEVVLSHSARMCPEALARGDELRLRRDAPTSPTDSGWRIGPLDPVAFAAATKPDRFSAWPPLEFVLEDAIDLLPYLALPPGFEILISGGEVISVRDSAGHERLAA
ncbi:MAG: tetratricopeptide repeat protein [Planctomycetes bacterium]|nr:tetratricopeptide repeat protein [Planctomycetota bacterium]